MHTDSGHLHVTRAREVDFLSERGGATIDRGRTVAAERSPPGWTVIHADNAFLKSAHGAVAAHRVNTTCTSTRGGGRS